jgi:NADPH2:quinone reductase
MRAWVITRHGQAHDVLRLEERPSPAPSPGQVLIRCEASGLNFADTMAVRGLYRDAPPPPCVPGYEVVGRVAAVGTGVDPTLMGRRVAAITRFGGYAEEAITDHRALMAVPEDMPAGEAAALCTQGCTAWYMSMVARPLHAGDRVLIHSAAGGVGQFLVRIALRQGCTVFAMAAGTEKMNALKALGVHHPIDRRAADATQQLRTILGRERIDVSFNAVGGTTFRNDMSLLAAGGAVVIFGGAERGAHRGPLATLRFVWNMGVLVPALLMMKSRSVIGVNMLRIGEQRPQLLHQCMTGVRDAHAAGWFPGLVHRSFPAKDLPDAVRMLGEGASMGKLVIQW